MCHFLVPYGAIRVLSGGRFWKTSFFGNVIRYYQNNLLHLFSKNSRGLFSSFLIPFHSICIKSLVKMFLSLVISKLTGFLFFHKLANLLFFHIFASEWMPKRFKIRSLFFTCFTESYEWYLHHNRGLQQGLPNKMQLENRSTWTTSEVNSTMHSKRKFWILKTLKKWKICEN